MDLIIKEPVVINKVKAKPFIPASKKILFFT